MMITDLTTSWDGYLRADGSKGIRNNLLVVYLVECAHHVSKEIAMPLRHENVQVIGFGGCYPNEYAHTMLQNLCTHANTGGVLLVSLGCESFNRSRLAEHIAASGRPVHTLVIQECGGTLKTIEAGQQWLRQTIDTLRETPRVTMNISDLIIGTICGGSDASSGISANPAVGHVFDRLSVAGATAIFEETGELIGCEKFLGERAATPKLKQELEASVAKAERYYEAMGHGSFAPGNAEGGLSTIEEKSLGAYAKSGTALISGILLPTEQPSSAGIYLLDVVPEGDPKFGYPNINDNAEIAELMACGAHMTLFTTGRGSVVGSAVSPVLKICANPDTYRRMSEDMDVNAGVVLESKTTPAEIGEKILEKIIETSRGTPTCSESLGHTEFVLTYKNIEPGCFPN
jgi:altronate dehydratase large subunit